MLDTLEKQLRAGSTNYPEMIELAETIKSDIRHVDRKLHAFTTIIEDVFEAEIGGE